MNVLMHQLKNLKLEGMYQALVLLQEAGDIQLSECKLVLENLINAEAEYRLDKKSLALVKRAQFRYHASMQTVVTGTERNLEKATVTRLSKGQYIRQGQSLLITGPTGAGKSWLASALGQQACRQGFKTYYYNCNKLWTKLRQARNRDRYEKEIKTISKSDLLILDDFGLSKLDSADRLSLLEILEDRWGKAATIVVSQRPLATWHEVLGDPTVADAICDRLFSNCEKIELKGDSLRKRPLPLDPNLPPS
jgi:DNA replication protein DnaC